MISFHKLFACLQYFMEISTQIGKQHMHMKCYNRNNRKTDRTLFLVLESHYQEVISME